jgi:hypothetical protein
VKQKVIAREQQLPLAWPQSAMRALRDMSLRQFGVSPRYRVDIRKASSAGASDLPKSFQQLQQAQGRGTNHAS